MPFQNEHDARLKSPDQYIRFRRENDKFGPGIHAIWGVTKDQKAELQSIRFDKTKYSESEAKKWLEEHKHSPISFEPAKDENKMASLIVPKAALNVKFIEDANGYGTLKNQVICKTGKFKAMTGEVDITNEFLEQLGDNYEKIKDKLKVPFILGHSENVETITPAIGWLENVKKVGNELFADILHIPKKICEIVKNKQYRGLSIEAGEWDDGTVNVNYGTCLLGLGLLGAAQPACSGTYIDTNNLRFSEDFIRDDIINFEMKLSELESTRNVLDIEDDYNSKKEDEIKLREEKMSEELAKKLKEKEQEITRLSTQSNEKDEELERLKTERKVMLAEKKKQAINTFIEKYSSEQNMKITLAQKPLFEELLNTLSDEKTIKLSEGNQNIECSQFNLLEKILDSTPDSVEFDEKANNYKLAKKKDEQKKDEIKDEDIPSGYKKNSFKAHKLAEKLCTENKELNYEDALNQVYKEKPELVNEEVQ